MLRKHIPLEQFRQEFTECQKQLKTTKGINPMSFLGMSILQCHFFKAPNVISSSLCLLSRFFHFFSISQWCYWAGTILILLHQIAYKVEMLELLTWWFIFFGLLRIVNVKEFISLVSSCHHWVTSCSSERFWQCPFELK